MTEDKKYETFIGCKLMTNNYESLFGMKTGTEIYEHLIAPCGEVYDEKGDQIKELIDYNIWYLATCSKFGELEITIDGKKSMFKWTFGEASYDIITEFIYLLDRKYIFSREQVSVLREIILEGRKNIACYTEISDYLKG